MDRVVLFRCPDCGKRKGVSEFHAHIRRVNGCSTYCIECTAIRSRRYYMENRERCVERARVYREANPDNRKKSRLKVKYGITIEDHTRMLQEQNFCCAACGVKFSPEGSRNRAAACVDHDHTTKDVRELLCAGCNLVLGQVEDRVEHLEALIAYLRRHGK